MGHKKKLHIDVSLNITTTKRTSLWKLLLHEFNISNNTNQRSNDSINNDNNIQLLFNYVKLPIHLEKFMIFGLIYTLVVFLKLLVIIPFRWIIHTLILIISTFTNKSKRIKLPKFNSISYKNDSIAVSNIIITLLLLKNIDTSRIYHNIRSGTAIKLYFMTQVLEIADRLLSASGIDILKSLFRINIRKRKINFIFIYGLSIIYLYIHSYVLVYQVMALNVAINSYSNALLTLILSNQFSELKSAVFKRTEREGLFQISSSDLNERFLLLIMLIIISSRNLLQILINTSSINDFFNNIKPNSWLTNITPWIMVDNWLGLLIGPSILVIGSELLVDWIKHSYIIRFNRIKPSIYDKYTKILSNDFINGLNGSSNQINDYPSLLTKRTGFPITTLLIVFCKLSVFPYIKHFTTNLLNNYSTIISSILILLLIIVLITLLIFIRLLLSTILLNWSKEILSKPILKNDYTLGEPNVNTSNISDVRKSLYNSEIETIPPTVEEKRLKKLSDRKVDADDSLSNVVRFEMADKRIW